MSDRPKYLQAEFVGFMRAVGLSDASPLQQREMLRAFMAGAKSFASIVERMTSEGDDLNAEDHAVVTALDAELNDFPLLVRRGDA